MKILNKEINATNFLEMSLVKKILALKFEYKLLMAGFVVLGCISYFNSNAKPVPAPTAEELPPESVDTFIPQGLVLIPLELSNSESLASIIGNMGGVVDLYLTSQEGRKGGYLVASRVKLVRAPRNPDQFAVLVKESEGQKILKQNGPFVAVVQNPEVRGSKVVQERKNSVQIEYAN
ncbi:hypothetical protein [Bdellovibrio sp. HCB209]|uniref:hypothetical protein n=1 Tax=Bdellovibrio sp. HCB209 TaxID=3394354 RepID=UPI0039B59429